MSNHNTPTLATQPPVGHTLQAIQPAPSRFIAEPDAEEAALEEAIRQEENKRQAAEDRIKELKWQAIDKTIANNPASCIGFRDFIDKDGKPICEVQLIRGNHEREVFYADPKDIDTAKLRLEWKAFVAMSTKEPEKYVTFLDDEKKRNMRVKRAIPQNE